MDRTSLGPVGIFLPALLFLALTLLLPACAPGNRESGKGEALPSERPSRLTAERAAYLSGFAFECIDRPYPNKPGHVMGDSTYLATPTALHPAFYGCFDWHSSVHGHWTLVSLLKRFPDLPRNDSILTKLTTNITTENIATELRYFMDEHNRNFERTYGWAWLLKLDEALREWEHPAAPGMQAALKPLSDTLAERLIRFLGKLDYPIRVGEHANTAFAMSLAMDYAGKYHPRLNDSIISWARAHYLSDADCPLGWEPSGFDFLSPCLQEASLMIKVLEKEAFIAWLDRFLPGWRSDPSRRLVPAKVSDRGDGNLAHLDGLNLSRSWCLYEIGHQLNDTAILGLADRHLDASFRAMDEGEYAGTHWLASFATLALIKAETASR